jgi:hypothetical protein
MATVMLWGVCLTSCRPVTLPPQPVPSPAKYMVPISAYGTDWLCAETNINVPKNDCVTIAEFRRFAASQRAEP